MSRHSTHFSESVLAAAAWDYSEHTLSDWLDGDDRAVTVYYSHSAADHDDDLPTVTVTGAATEAEHGYSEVYDRAGFAALIGDRFVVGLEAAKAEEGL